VWGGISAGRIGRNLTVTADKKIMENSGGTQQSSTALLSLPAIFSIFSLFKLSYSNIFECPRNGVNNNTRQMLPKWKATTSHIFYILWPKQSSSLLIVNKHEHPS
jgi:hypothetical protein